MTLKFVGHSVTYEGIHGEHYDITEEGYAYGSWAVTAPAEEEA